MFNIAGNGSSGYNLTNSLRFRSNASAASTAYLTRTPASNTNRTTWTWSGWVKRAFISSSGETNLFSATISGSDRVLISFYQDKLNLYGVSGGTAFNLISAAVFRDPSAWYHVVVRFDTTQATAANRIKFYINGVEITAFGTATYPNLNQSLAINSTNQHQIGRHFDGTSQVNFMDGYMAEVNFVDGTALTPSSFGSTDSTTGQWLPAKYTGTYGTNGFYLPFTDNSALTTASNAGLGKDFSGNANYWVTNNISITAGATYDAMIDVPTLTSATAANYPTINPLNLETSVAVSAMTYSEGNLKATSSDNLNHGWAATMAIPANATGKYYFEFTVTSVFNFQTIGLSNNPTYLRADNGNNGYFYAYSSQGGKYFGSSTVASYGGAWAANDIIGVAFNATTGDLTFYKNNTSQGSAGTMPTGVQYFPAFYSSNTNGWSAYINFGQRPFTYTPPTGYVALNTYNLPTPTIKKGSSYMDATLYTGTGATLSVTNASAFKPDLVWIKGRSGATDNALYDFVRGTTKDLVSNSTAAETTQATGLTAFNTNGFTVGALAKLNTSAATYVGWQWAGTGATVSNTSGTITSTVDANTTAGFSIATFTGTGANATVGHGLGVAPKMIFVKSRSNANGWIVWHTSLTSGAYFLDLQGTSTQTLGTDVFQSTIPSSTVVTVGTNVNTNRSAGTFLIYAWAEIAGYSKFGSYTGNGSTDGTFVYTGFRPKFVMIKRIDTAANWIVMDSARNTYNQVNLDLPINLNQAEETIYAYEDFISNGIKIRTTDASWNASGGTYIYMAFAETPFKNSNAR